MPGRGGSERWFSSRGSSQVKGNPAGGGHHGRQGEAAGDRRLVDSLGQALRRFHGIPHGDGHHFNRHQDQMRHHHEPCGQADAEKSSQRNPDPSLPRPARSNGQRAAALRASRPRIMSNPQTGTSGARTSSRKLKSGGAGVRAPKPQSLLASSRATVRERPLMSGNGPRLLRHVAQEQCQHDDPPEDRRQHGGSPRLIALGLDHASLPRTSPIIASPAAVPGSRRW